MNMRETIEKATKAVAEWNEKYVVGQWVHYNQAAGLQVTTRTTSEAKLVGFEAVVYIKDANGHRPLGKMTPMRR